MPRAWRQGLSFVPVSAGQPNPKDKQWLQTQSKLGQSAALATALDEGTELISGDRDHESVSAS